MNENLNKTRDFIKVFIEVFTFLFIICYIIGFLICNFYLLKLGFFDLELLQSRYILIGFLFVSTTIIFFALVYVGMTIFCLSIANKISSFFRKLIRKDLQFQIPVFMALATALLIVINFYAINIFPTFRLDMGGGRPRYISLLVSEEKLKYLSNFGIGTVEGGSTQTENLCIAFETSNALIILLKDRVLQVNKIDLLGFASLPIKERGETEINYCVLLSEFWLKNKAQLKK